MKMANLIHQTLPLAGGILLACCISTAAAADKTTDNAADSEQVLAYKLALAEDGETYQVWMKPSALPKPDLSLTGQATIRVPNDSTFKIIDVQNHAGDATWIETARTDAPEENPEYDYISFSYIGLTGNANFYQWAADEEKLVFSFRNGNGCVSDVSLMGNDDPFNVPNNSAGTRPGNQFTNIGWGMVESNNYKDNYGAAISCS